MSTVTSSSEDLKKYWKEFLVWQKRFHILYACEAVRLKLWYLFLSFGPDMFSYLGGL